MAGGALEERRNVPSHGGLYLHRGAESSNRSIITSREGNQGTAYRPCQSAEGSSSGERAMSSLASATSTRPTMPPTNAETIHAAVTCCQIGEW